MTDPDYATFRDLVETVNTVDEKLDSHKIEVEKRMGRLEKGLAVLAVIVLIPKIGGPSVSEVATHIAALTTHIF